MIRSLQIMIVVAAISQTASVANAQQGFEEIFCHAMTGTGLVGRCSVLGADKTIAAFIHTDSSETTKMCRDIVDMIDQYPTASKGWRLKIYSPFNHGVPLASCRFR